MLYVILYRHEGPSIVCGPFRSTEDAMNFTGCLAVADFDYQYSELVDAPAQTVPICR